MSMQRPSQPPSLETRDLTFSFSPGETVLNRVNLQVSEGTLYGFLGPNGAGKTTTLRLALGLLKKQQGSISFFGRPFHLNRIDILREVGTLIESPSLYSHLTATENLRLLQRIYRCPTARIQEVLRTVGLPDTGTKKAGQFSLGMKQRLSIAIALLNNPRLLILDEPTNGLDPNGIIEVRELLRQMNRNHGITVIISSHLLSEIERLVTHIGIINKGSMLFQGTLDELKNKQENSQSIVIETNDPHRSAQILQDLHLPSRMENGKNIVVAMPKERVAGLNRELVKNGIDVYGISTVRDDLEKIFIDLVNT